MARAVWCGDSNYGASACIKKSNKLPGKRKHKIAPYRCGIGFGSSPTAAIKQSLVKLGGHLK